MDGTPGVAVAVPCLVLSSAGLSIPARDKGAGEAGPAAVVSLDGALGAGGGHLAVVKAETGEVALINTRGGEPGPKLGLAGTAGSPVAFMSTEAGVTKPIVLGAGMKVEADTKLSSSVVRVCGVGSGACSGDRGSRRGDKGTPGGLSDESERLAQYNETVTLLMQPELGDKDSTTSENTNQDSHSSAGEGAPEAGNIKLGRKWLELPARLPQPLRQGSQGVGYVLGEPVPSLDGRGGLDDCERESRDGRAGERRTEEWRSDCSGALALARDGADVRTVLRVVEAGLRTMRPKAPEGAFSKIGDGRCGGAFASDSEQEFKTDGEGVSLPFYVACQQLKKQQQQQQKEQQHHAHQQPLQQQPQVPLWWQAYLSGLYNGYGLASGPSTTPPPTRPPPPPPPPPPVSSMRCLSLPPGWVVNAGAVRSIQEVHEGQDDGHMRDYDYGGQKRSRAEDDLHCVKLRLTKKGRKRVEDRVCSNCCTRVTPFWRKDRQSGKPLCNACGLYFSKNDVPRPISLWRNAGGSEDP